MWRQCVRKGKRVSCHGDTHFEHIVGPNYKGMNGLLSLVIKFIISPHHYYSEFIILVCRLCAVISFQHKVRISSSLFLLKKTFILKFENFPNSLRLNAVEEGQYLIFR